MMNTMLYQFHINFNFQAAEIIGAVLIVLALFAAFALPRLLTTKASEQQAKKITIICKLIGMVLTIGGVICIIVLS